MKMRLLFILFSNIEHCQTSLTCLLAPRDNYTRTSHQPSASINSRFLPEEGYHNKRGHSGHTHCHSRIQAQHRWFSTKRHSNQCINASHLWLTEKAILATWFTQSSVKRITMKMYNIQSFRQSNWPSNEIIISIGTYNQIEPHSIIGLLCRRDIHPPFHSHKVKKYFNHVS